MNKNVLVTGGANGLGKAMVTHVLSRGGRVFITDINNEAGVKTLTELSERFGSESVGFHVHDVTLEESWSEVWEEAEKFFSQTGGVEVSYSASPTFVCKVDNDSILNFQFLFLFSRFLSIMLAWLESGTGKCGMCWPME